MSALWERRRDAEYEAADEWAYENRVECGWCAEPVGEDGHPECERAIEARSCHNPACREFGTCFADYQRGEPCEVCGMPLGACPECAGTGDDPVHTWGNGDIPNPSLAALHAACERCDGTGLAS